MRSVIFTPEPEVVMKKYAVFVFIFFSVVTATLCASMSSEMEKTKVYLGEVQLTDGECRFKVEIDPVGFLLTSVADKYKMLFVRVDCIGSSPFKMSRQKDTIYLILSVGGQKTRVRAILDLQTTDPPFWDSLDVAMREVLAYPLGISESSISDPQRSRGLYFYFFVPKDSIGSLPEAIEYTIDSLGKSTLIEPRPQLAR